MLWKLAMAPCAFHDHLGAEHVRRETAMQAVVLLDGKQVTDFSFTNGVFKTTAPIAWATPNGETASVNLSLQFSAFSGAHSHLVQPGTILSGQAAQAGSCSQQRGVA